ncbi:MAG: AarF/ABC1/UbiB kinase family protein [Myxococcales bacterium]|nr:AarF/ABC1/UbiB kinase family protein [Myxococcales bacterium]
MVPSAPPRNPSFVGVAVRDLGRLRTVATAVARHGFGELLMRTPVGRRLFHGHAPEGDARLGKAPAAERFAKLLASLGPTYIKLGQILSMRRDILPADYIAALERLQDDAPVLPFEQVRDQVAEGLGEPLEVLFAQFDETPLATASIAQTHLATTHDGDRVVVKVQRPGIAPILKGDVDLLYLGAQVLEASIDEMRLVGPAAIVEEFERGLMEELNFQTELSNLMIARQNLDPERRMIAPRPHPELSCRTVLTMDFFEGRSVRKLERESPLAKLVVEEVLHAAFKQVFVDGFFHADPHAGNLLVNDEGVCCMIDLGLVGRLDADQRADIVTLILATIAGESSTIARVLLKMGTPTQRVNLAELRAEIDRVRRTYLVVESLDDVDSAGFAQAFAAAAQRFRIRLAPEYALLVKAATTIEGLIRHLDPHVDLVGIGRPYAERIMAERMNPKTLLREIIGEAGGVGALLRGLPAQLDQILHDVETGNLQFRAVTPTLDGLPSMLHSVTKRLSLAAFAVAMTLACVLAIPPPGRQGWGWWVVCVVSGVVSVGAWLSLAALNAVGSGKPLRVSPLLRFFRR